MRVDQFKICGNYDFFDGIQTMVRHKRRGISLSKFGNGGTKSKEECMDWFLPDGEYVEKVEWSYGKAVVRYLNLMTNTGVSISRGHKRIHDSQASFHFDDKDPFIGFDGYQATNAVTREGKVVKEIMALAVIKNICSPERDTLKPVEPIQKTRIIEKIIQATTEDEEGRSVTIVASSIIILSIIICVICIIVAQKKRTRELEKLEG